MSQRKAQYAHALAALRSRILHGDFETGERLREVEISEQLGVSRTPLRQSMDRLVEESLLERMDNGGCRVASLSIGDIVDAIELRGVLEGVAARMAAERGVSDEDLAEADRLLTVLDKAVSGAGDADFPSYVEANAALHALIARASGSAIMIREIERAHRLPVASPSAFLQGQELVPNFWSSLIYAQEQHRAVIEAIRLGEGSRAEALMREHARLARQNLEYIINEKPSLAARVPGLALVASS